MKKHKNILLIILILIFINTDVSAALSNNILNSVVQNKEEKNKNKTIKLAVISNWSVDETGNNTHFKLIDLFKKYANLTVIPITFDKWDIAYKQAKEGKNIDGIMGLSWSKNRKKNDFLFSKAYKITPYYLIVKNDSTIEKVEDLKNKTVYINKISPLKEMLKIKIPSVEILYTEDKYDAYFSFQANYQKLKLNNLKIIDTIYDAYGEISLGISRNKPDIYIKIQEAFSLIPKEELLAISNNKLGFTKKENEWLNKNQSLNYSYNTSFKPLEWMDELKEHKGIIKDILNIIETKSSIKFKEAKNNKTINMYSALVKNDDKNLSYTKNTIFRTPFVFLSKGEQNYNNGFNDALNKRVALIKNSPMIKLIKEFRPEIKLIIIEDMISAFNELDEKDIDILIINATSAKYYLNTLGFDNLRISYKTIFSLDLRIAIDESLPNVVLSILDKLLLTISEKQRNDIANKWADVRVENKTDWLFIFQIIGLVLFILIVLIINNYRLKSLVEKKTKDIETQKNEIENTLSSFDKNVMFTKTDLEGVITHASEAFCKFSAYKQEELIGKSHNIMRHPDTPSELYRTIWDSLKAEIPIVKEFKTLKKNGSSYWVEVLFSPIYDTKGKLTGYSGIRQDVSDKKEVEDLSANLELKVIDRTKALNKAKKEIEETHKNTRDSIEYASLIQKALIPEDDFVQGFFQDSFIWWNPKDVVGGDIFLFETLRNENECLFMVIDCAGHGVPGAFATMLVKAIERELVAKLSKSLYEIDTSIILRHFNQTMKKLLHQENDDAISNAGFDGAIVYINKDKNLLRFCGAHTDLYYMHNDSITMIKGNKQSVGYRQCKMDYPYKEYEMSIEEGMQFYLSTDGYIDQKGGEKGFSFGKRKFKSALEEVYNKPMKEQLSILQEKMIDYQQDYFRIDDSTVFGWRV